MERKLRLLDVSALLLASSLAAGCGGEETNNDTPDAGEEPPIEVPSYSASGTVTDFYTGDPVAGEVTVSTRGLIPEPDVEVTGADFTFDGIPPSSVFYLSSSSPEYRTTYSRAVEVVEEDVYDITVSAVDADYLSQLSTDFDVTPVQGTAILLAKVVDEYGEPVSGVPAEAFYVNGDSPPTGPYFLDESKQAAPALNATSTSGYVLLYDIPVNADENVVVSEAPDSGYYLSMPVSPAVADGVTLAYVTVTENQVQPPEDVSFSQDILPIFENRGCKYCHTGNGAGRQDGGLALQASPDRIHNELTEELSPSYQITRVNLDSPEDSLILTMPGPVIDNHPNTTFPSEDDPDYQLILSWIQQGALNN